MRGQDRVFYWKGARTNYHYRPVCQTPLPTLADCTISDDCSGKFSAISADRLQYDFIDGVCVYLIDHPYTYRHAKTLCEGEGTHLVHVQDPAMQQAIQESFQRTQFWTGLKKINGVWKWVGLGGEKEIMDTPRWENGFPPSDSNDVVMYTTQGNDRTGAPAYNWKGARVNYSYRVVCQTPRC
ncbi:L-selectin-like [Haliotis asinina]|uniref:L-selectin-like n=1 Tax=Haliotis asinina TaxID=109174 RepID=UPI00353193C2